MRIPPRYRRDKAEKRHRERGSGRRPDAGGLCRGGEGAIQRGERQPHAQRELKTHGVVDRQAVLVGESQRRPPDAGRGYRVQSRWAAPYTAASRPRTRGAGRGHPRPRRPRRGSCRRARRGTQHADAGRYLRDLPGGQSQPRGEDRQALPPEPQGQSRGLAGAPARRHLAPGRGGPLQPDHRPARLGGRPTRRSRCCARSTAGPASTARGCATRSSCGWLAAGGSTASGGGASRPRPWFCRAGARGSRRRCRMGRCATSS